MARKYELWLDESGKFEDGEAKRAQENPSLIGGVLVEKAIVEHIKFDEFSEHLAILWKMYSPIIRCWKKKRSS